MRDYVLVAAWVQNINDEFEEAAGRNARMRALPPSLSSIPLSLFLRAVHSRRRIPLIHLF